jgi:hypothetical protein
VGETHARSNDEKVHFIEAGRVKPKQLMERRLEFCALLVDATPFQGQQMVAALGIGWASGREPRRTQPSWANCSETR